MSLTEPPAQPSETTTSGLPSKSPFPADIVGVLIFFVGLLEYFQYTTLEKFNVLTPAVRYGLSFDILTYLSMQAELNQDDAIIFILIVCTFLFLIVLELWKQRLTLLLRYLFASERRTLTGLLATSLVLVRFYFARGSINWSGDGSSHMCYAWIASQSFANGEIPIWTNYLGTGSPYLQFYGFLYFYTVGMFNQIIGNLDTTIKLVLATAHVMSGLGMYLFIRRMCGSRPAGFIAGLAYVLCMWHTQQTLIMGRFPLSLFYALLPFPFYAVECLRFKKPVIPILIGGGLTLGVLAFVHPGYAFWATAALACYIVIRAFTAQTRQPRRSVLIFGFALWSLGIVFGAYLTVPMWAERAYVELEEITHAAVPDPTWGHLFVWSNYRIQLFAFPGYDNWYGGYLGLSLVLLSLVALAGFAHKQHRRLIPAVGLCLVVSFILVLGYRWPIIRDLDIVKAFNAGRYLLFVTFFLSATAGIGTQVLHHKCRKYIPNVMALVVLVILTDLGSTTFQHPYAQTNRTFLDLSPEFYNNLKTSVGEFPKGQLPNFRLSYPMFDIFDLLGIAWFTTHMGIPSYLTGYREGPPAQSKFCGPLQKWLNAEFNHQDTNLELINSPRLDLIMAGLYLLNTRFTYVLISQTQNLKNIAWPYHSPIVVAPEIQPWTPSESYEQDVEYLLQHMEIDPIGHTCKRLHMSGIATSENLGTRPEIKIENHTVWNQRVELTVVLSAPAFAQLSYAYYPYLDVQVDQQSVAPYQTAGGFIGLKLDTGEHTIVLEPYLSPLRRSLFILDIVILIASALYLIKMRRQKPTW